MRVDGERARVVSKRRAEVVPAAERAERRRVRHERALAKAEEIGVLRALVPPCEAEGDPPVAWQRVARIAGNPKGVLLESERISGRGNPGPRLVVAARSYDGCGPNGGEARDYVVCFVVFRTRGGAHLRRSVGVAFYRGELRKVAAALVKHADALDLADAANGAGESLRAEGATDGE